VESGYPLYENELPADTGITTYADDNVLTVWAARPETAFRRAERQLDQIKI